MKDRTEKGKEGSGGEKSDTIREREREICDGEKDREGKKDGKCALMLEDVTPM